MLKHKKAVIFDLDGTIADSMWIWTKIDEQFFRERHIEMPASLQAEIEGFGFTETAEFFVRTFHLPETVEQLKEIWNGMALDKYRHDVSLKPGVRDFMHKLKQRGIRMGISTSNSNLLIEAFLQAKGLTKYIDAVTTSCDVSRGKPAPDVYLKTAEKLNVSPTDCLVFEDIPMGILAGKNAGMEVCAVEDVYSASAREQKRALADYYIDHFSQTLDGTYEVLS